MALQQDLGGRRSAHYSIYSGFIYEWWGWETGTLTMLVRRIVRVGVDSSRSPAIGFFFSLSLSRAPLVFALF